MSNTIHWGIMGTGKIAGKFAQGLATLPDAKLQAVGSRKAETAQAFARTYHVPNAHASYEALVEDPSVDIIYVASPHPFHLANASLCLQAGKPVLCEKPLTVNARETEQLIELADKQQLFLMEAMWTRFLPAIVELRKWMEEQKIGELLKLQADFSFIAPFDPQRRTYNPDLAGGALLDIGIYPIAFAYMLFKEEPEHVSSFAQLGKTGTDDQSTYLFGYAGGRFANLSASFRSDFQKKAYVIGTKGMIELPLFWKASSLILHQGEAPPQTFEFPYAATGLQFQAVEAMQCLRAGKLQSEVMPWRESLRIMQRMDGLRASWGLRYPFE